MPAKRATWTDRGWAGAMAFVAAIVAMEPAMARAAEPVPSGATESHETSAPYSGRRVWGLGSMVIGGGYAGARLLDPPASSTVAALAVSGPALLFPTLEAQGFRRNGHSIDISIPITNMVITSVALRGFVFNVDAFYNFNVGKRAARLIAGPGLGVALGGTKDIFEFSARIPAELGLEVLTKGQRFGFKLVTRPWFEAGLVRVSGDSIGAIGGGAIVAIGLSGYRVQR